MIEVISTKKSENVHISARKVIYLPGLNGLRAIAALAVVVSHITLALEEFGLNNKIFGVDRDGNASGLSLAGHGVTIFFTLSGFLITYLLLKEKEISPINIKNFYVRRVLRIWPLYYLYLFICIVTILFCGISYIRSSFPFYVFLAANIPFIIGKTLPFLAHYWSIGVEEQFYLFFPHIAKYSNKKMLIISSTLILSLLTLKFFFWIIYKKYGVEHPFLAISITRFDIMLIGVVGAILYYYGNRRFLRFATHKLTQILSWFCIFFIALNKFHFASVIDAEVVSIVSLFLITGQVTKKNKILNLENKLCDFIGKISYGIYVIHPLLIFLFRKLIGKFDTDGFQNYVYIYSLIIATTIFIAYLSYEFYEKRFLNLRLKFSTIKSSNSKNS